MLTAGAENFGVFLLKKAPVIKKAPPCCVPIFNKGGLS